MFTPITRLFILTFISIAAIIMAMQGKMFMLILASFLSMFLLWDYAVRKTVPLAYNRLLRKDYTGAEKAIQYTSNTNRLSKTNTAKYYAVKGLLAHYHDDFEEAKGYLDKALKFTNDNKQLGTMCVLSLTDIALINKDFRQARSYFNLLKGMNVPKNLEATVQKLGNDLELFEK